MEIFSIFFSLHSHTFNLLIGHLKLLWLEQQCPLKMNMPLMTKQEVRTFGGIQPSSIGDGNGTPLQYYCLENPMDGGAWWAAVHGVAISRTRLSDFTFPFHFHALEKEMASHSSVLAWRIPGMGEPGGLPSMASQSRTRLKRLSNSSSNSPQYGISTL